MTDAPEPVPPPRPSSGLARWKTATAVAVAAGLVVSGAIYVVMERRADDLSGQLAAAESNERSGGGLGELLGGLLDDPDELGQLLDWFIGEDFDDIDPVLFECLAPQNGLGLNFGPGSIPDADIETQVAAVTEIIERERGLPADGEFDIEFVSLMEVQERAVDINAEHLDREEAAVNARLLAGLGAIEPGLDLVQAQLNALEVGVAGFYSQGTGELVIGSETMDGMGAFITAHELVHAMADAAFGLADLEELAEHDGSDAAYAALSAIEGDASLYSQRFATDHLPFDQLLELEAESGTALDALAELPYFVRRNLEFPYVEGMTFTCHVFLDGGWEAVDETYHDPPSTSAQVLFPDRYWSGEGAVDVRQPAGPAGWELLDTDSFGAADLLFLLEAPGDDEAAALSDPLDRAAAWAGGSGSVWGHADRTAVALVLADRGSAPPLCETITEFYAAAFPDATRSAGADVTFDGPAQAAVVACTGSEVALGIGPDLATARATVG